MVAPRKEERPVMEMAKEFYVRHLRSKLEPRENGKFLVLNVDTGEYELDADDVSATERATSRFGNARLAILRVGHEAAYRLGGAGKAKSA
ncbi:hypothetical protein PHYC_01116 [Phycisphaerales bacterium]|nr:hypothetical protein PHYC_01116 [Phycisphaerales bacterium]